MTVERSTTKGGGAERRRAAAREIREELERLRRSEAKIAEALGSARASRQRVEELVHGLSLEDEGVRDLIRQELRAVQGLRAGGAPALPDDAGVSGLFRAGEQTPASEEPEAPSAEPSTAAAEDAQARVDEPRRSFWLLGASAVGVVAVAVAGWVAFQSFRGADQPPTLTVGGDSALPLSGPVAGANGVLQERAAKEEDPEAAEAAQREAARFFTLLPEPASQRAAVYDSLWQAHSTVLNPLFERVEGATQESTVRRALEAWRTKSLTPLQRDLLHSALVQYSLREETGAALTVDGQLLRNPCRGASCSALLNFWETRGESYGLPPVPEDAPSNSTALRIAENVLVLRTLENVHRTRTSNGS